MSDFKIPDDIHGKIARQTEEGKLIHFFSVETHKLIEPKTDHEATASPLVHPEFVARTYFGAYGFN